MVLPDFVDLNKIAAGVFCWLYQYGMRHLGGVTAMVRSPEIFEPVTLFRWPEGGSPSKIFAPRNILGLRNPHRGRRRGAVPYRRRGSSGRPPVAGGAAVADPAGRRQRPGRAEGRQQGGEAEKKGGRGIDKASDCLLSLSPKPKALSR